VSNLININKEYLRSRLFEVNPNPYIQFQEWFREACEAMPSHLVNCMVLATCSEAKQPSARIVLLKEYNEQGFIFHTNYQSRKGLEITANSAVSLLFWWELLERQVRIDGFAEKIPAEASDDYFRSRPKTSQIAALASSQSQKLAHVEDLQEKYQKLSAEYASAESIVPRPPHWGGYIVKPQRFEFWQGRENRLHDRFEYTPEPENHWAINRLFP